MRTLLKHVSISLPKKSFTVQLADYEKKVMGLLPLELQKELRRCIFEEKIQKAPHLKWLSTFQRAVIEVVDIAQTIALPPDSVIFEAEADITHVITLRQGTVKVEDNINRSLDEGKRKVGTSDMFSGEVDADAESESSPVPSDFSGAQAVLPEGCCTRSNKLWDRSCSDFAAATLASPKSAERSRGV